MQFEPDPAFPPRRPYGGWGGRRPGAGARRGNLNALKHGRYSRQMLDLARFLAGDPQFSRLRQRLRTECDHAGNDRDRSPPANLGR